MAGRQIYNPDGFKNMEKDGQTTGFQFEMKAQYYRGMTLLCQRRDIHHGRNENRNRFRLQMGVRRFCDNQCLKGWRTFQGNTSH